MILSKPTLRWALISGWAFFLAQLQVCLATEGGGWKAIPEEELAASEPRIDPKADVEYLYRDIRINDTLPTRTVSRYHVRAKIFTEAGALQLDKIDIPYATGWRVSNVKARVVYPNGEVVPLLSKDIYRRQIFKDGRFETYATSFSFPGLRPGCIVEYSWKQTRLFWQSSLNYSLLAKWPTWQIDLTIKPNKNLASRVTSYFANVEWTNNSNGYSLSLENLRAASSERHAAPTKEFEPWVYMGYASELDVLTPEQYWNYRGGDLVQVNEASMRPKSKAVKNLAKQLFSDLNNHEDKLKAAYDYCVSEITNIQSYTTRYTEQELEDLKENKTPADTIKRGYGTRFDINALFASLAAAAGFETSMAFVEDSHEYRFNRYGFGGYNLSDYAVAITVGDNYRFFDPGSSFLPFEHLNPENTGAEAMVVDKKYFYWTKTHWRASDYSRTNRILTATLDTEGNLSGKVVNYHLGFESLWRKRSYVSLTLDELENLIFEQIWESQFPRASVSNVEIRGLNKRDGKLLIKYDLSIPFYADALGDRMILNPNVFEAGKEPEFTSRERVAPIAFPYTNVIQDKVTISVPEGYFDDESYAHSYNLENDIFAAQAATTFDQESNTLTFQRMENLRITRLDGTLYPMVKANFDELHNRDSQPFILKSEDTAGETVSSR